MMMNGNLYQLITASKALFGTRGLLLEDGALIHGSKHALDPEDKEAEEGDPVVTIDCKNKMNQQHMTILVQFNST